jgi:hypothetical protein
MDEIDCIQIEIIELQEKIKQLRALLHAKLTILEEQAADTKRAQDALKSS